MKRQKILSPLTEKSSLEDTTVSYVAEYSILLIRMAFFHADFLIFRANGKQPRCRLPPSCSDFAKSKSEQEENTMEITIKINGRMVSVEVSDEVAVNANLKL